MPQGEKLIIGLQPVVAYLSRLKGLSVDDEPPPPPPDVLYVLRGRTGERLEPYVKEAAERLPASPDAVRATIAKLQEKWGLLGPTPPK